ncbi:MAG: flagellar biosynthetic protein FliR [Micavibrio aeruginosavorus]|uniref:Flagellar biosynthetic protein FliR n=1 Tax=Micavibrio aeruginosavorus TaxID=349221 RepID=A0A2W5QAL2_9BACT|nr:MAG: flagellar biosynthetic protein FliR [Micavibrio aeruginosavorus]
MNILEQFLTTGIFAFIIIFVRFGTALMIMPGIGDTFVPQNIRLFIALGLSLVVSPVIRPHLPDPLPGFGGMLSLIAVEFITGLFIGTIARVLMMALDTAGMLISLASGISNAQVFNPSLAVQGSVFGAFLSVTGVTLLFVTNLHHMLIHGLVESYEMFPIGTVPDTGSMAELMAKAVAASFMTGFQIALPFIVVSLLLYTGMGVLSRLMPQLQVFMIVIPVQILLAVVMVAISLSAMMLFFISRFEDGMVYFLSQGG